MLAYSEFFYLVHAGQGRWSIKHRITDEPAGVVTRSGAAFDIYDDSDRLVGTSDTIEHALGELYASA
ncbi:hypothetical protein [Subtercola boreus]|uniref:Uncharacterized protein n=1 Tax=Subtercola boreus TaxID=120213 RepID=A0A3E0WGI4_9MICO|nr:hypothetical protein [Subtercola boreus]RFA23353.1 hypothetical protein B7R24_00130 [Subtercola boreus]RFA23746.1 hypothetical protein B7R23_00130 [Subtercola boreus]RFA29446.1 hypothetical protein B7R25_00125 [Subtercola boreus]